LTTTLLYRRFDGTNALLYRTVDSGAHYNYKSTAGNQIADIVGALTGLPRRWKRAGK
jgi:hypothetical protein